MKQQQHGVYFGLLFGAMQFAVTAIILYKFLLIDTNPNHFGGLTTGILMSIQHLFFAAYFGNLATKPLKKKTKYALGSGIYWSLQLLVVSAFVSWILLIITVRGNFLRTMDTTFVLIYWIPVILFGSIVPSIGFGILFGYVLKKRS